MAAETTQTANDARSDADPGADLCRGAPTLTFDVAMAKLARCGVRAVTERA